MVALYEIKKSSFNTPYKVIAYGSKIEVALKITASSVVFHLYIKETPLTESDLNVLESLHFLEKSGYWALSVACPKGSLKSIIIGGILFALLKINIWESPYPDLGQF